MMSAWTLSVHVCVLFGWNLKNLLLLVPFVVSLFFIGFFHCLKKSPNSFETEAISYERAVVGLLLLAWIFLAYAVTRSDLDDAYFTAVAAFSSSHPESSLLAVDPMFGEKKLPLPFPSCRFSSFELISGAIAYLFSVPAMDPYYIYLLPVWLMVVLAATFLLTKEIIPQRWILAGVIAFLFTLLLGEMHRGPANFSFVRIFQGKAVFLSAIVPLIFYFTAKFLSKRGTLMDLFLLGCCQMTSIGLSHFGTLMAPIAGFGALFSNVPLIISNWKKACLAFAMLLIPAPYLIYIMLQSKNSPLLNFPLESSTQVWSSVMGIHQQYLIGLLLIIGPILAKNSLMRWRLAIPIFLFFFIYLNPYLSEFISKYVTTPAVYWRISWSFPILIFSAISYALVIDNILEKKPLRHFYVSLWFFIFGLILYSLPYNTLREKNIGPFEGFAVWKVPSNTLGIAMEIITIIGDNGTSLLAPDEIAGVVSRFEKHPRLVNVRGMYLDILKPSFSSEEYSRRIALYNLTLGTISEEERFIEESLKQLNVSIVIIAVDNESSEIVHLLHTAHYKRIKVKSNYAFWVNKTSSLRDAVKQINVTNNE
ncbi:hypothetical protein Lsai_1334 [Legionella sainthelensi]|uniref:Transmembrane protein n=2 Tax=Legionella sainthelensi TaxID=28087 RepID=A0A0W0YPD1_9GAMM|nr:DUF6077 domain-containing protein [Legionella sainthelensi]KTD58727.1 hypothetical protein Lsai_1334 [Legionella sainthelensi]VEH34736.1 Uncharacterised protein [Legionella sainthelensi]